MRLLSSLWLLLLLPVAYAQTTGVLRGRVLDPSGSAVPNASVAITGPAGATRAVPSDDSGTYIAPGLLPGPYSIRVTAAGFAPLETQSQIDGGRIVTLDLRLTVALGRQEVTVQEQTRAVEATPNTPALSLQGQDLDMFSSNPDDLADELTALAGPAVGPNGGQILVDGFSNGQLPSKESIREIRVNSNPFSSEFDRPGQGRVEVFTRPGTDRLRGNLQLNLGDNAFNARNPFSPSKPSMHMRQYSANVGGSLNKKTSFNTDFGRNVQDDANFINAQILDADLQPVRLQQNVPNPNHRNSINQRIDYAFTPNLTLQGRYTFTRNAGENNGVGSFNLLSRAQSTSNQQQGVQLSSTQVIGTRLIHETRFQYTQSRVRSSGVSATPTLQVLDAFTGGGAAAALTYSNSNSYEAQDYLSYSRGTHYWKAGVRMRTIQLESYSNANFNGSYVFTSLNAYTLTLRGLRQGLSFDQIRAQGGGARQYSVTGGETLAGVSQFDAAPFVQDDWKVRPNLTLSLGLRYEIQTNISDRRALAPRLGFAWGLGPGRTPKWVLRAGFGLFYDRVNQNLTLQAVRYSGSSQQTIVVQEPQFFPVAPPLDQLLALRRPQSVYRLAGDLVAPTSYVSGISVEHQLPHGLSFNVAYNDARSAHELRTRNINAPLPGTYSGPGTGVYPLGNSGLLFLYESSARLVQQQTVFTLNARVNSKLQLFGWYAYTRAFSDSDGYNNFPANSYNARDEWGRANSDTRHRGQIGGNFTTFGNVRVSPNIGFTSAAPFNIITGLDSNGDSVFNERPAFATDASRPSVRSTAWGLLDANPLPGARIVPRNFGEGFGRIDISGRVSRSWSFGEAVATSGARNASASAGRYTLTLSVQARNAINHTNNGTPNGNLSSTLFGQPLNIGGGGASANRRVEVNLRFEF